MEFKITYKNNKSYYFVDNKRVSKDMFNTLSELCQKKRMQYSNSYLWTDAKGVQRSGFSYN